MNSIEKFKTYFESLDKKKRFNFESQTILDKIMLLDSSLNKSTARIQFIQSFTYKKTSLKYYIERGWSTEDATEKLNIEYTNKIKIRNFDIETFIIYLKKETDTINYNSTAIIQNINFIFDTMQEITSKYDLMKYMISGFKYKRPSIEYYIERGWSIEEAKDKLVLITNRRKLTEHKFIELYGQDEGKLKWIDFKDKSKHTKEKFILRYGDDKGAEKWSTYIQNCSYTKTLDGYKTKYGLELGTEKWADKNRKQSFSNTLEGYISRFGYTEGKIKWDTQLRNKKRNKDFFITKYGIDEGNRRFNSFREKSSNTLINFQRVYGFQDGIDKYETYIKKLKYSNSIKGYIGKYGLENGTKIFKSKLKKMNSQKGKIGEASKESLQIFKLLEEYIKETFEFKINEDYFYGVPESTEFSFDGDIRLYDFCILPLKLIFEYNGSHIHPSKDKLNKMEWNSWKNPYNGQNADTKYVYDQNKIKYANDNGYRVVELWDYNSKYNNFEIIIAVIDEIISQDQIIFQL